MQKSAWANRGSFLRFAQHSWKIHDPPVSCSLRPRFSHSSANGRSNCSNCRNRHRKNSRGASRTPGHGVSANVSDRSRLLVQNPDRDLLQILRALGKSSQGIFHKLRHRISCKAIAREFLHKSSWDSSYNDTVKGSCTISQKGLCRNFAQG